jgi:hypothetical protein
MRKLARLSIAIGGFLILASLMLTGIGFLALSNIIDLPVFAEKTTVAVLTFMFLAVGLADFIAGIIALKR